jgi:hypothetical protein
MQMLREVESAVSRLREGLPKEAEDADMEEPMKTAELFQAEFVVPVRRLQPPSASYSATGAEPSDDGGITGDERLAAKDKEGELTGLQDDEGQAFEAPAGEPQKVVAALQELDDSDAEPECKSGSTYDEFGVRYPNKPLRLWRTARDRATWLADVRRAELAGSISGAVFCAATLLDRSQPLTIRLANFARMAAVAAQAGGGVEGVSEAVPGGEAHAGASLGLRSSKRLRESASSAGELSPNDREPAAPVKVRCTMASAWGLCLVMVMSRGELKDKLST